MNSLDLSGVVASTRDRIAADLMFGPHAAGLNLAGHVNLGAIAGHIRAARFVPAVAFASLPDDVLMSIADVIDKHDRDLGGRFRVDLLLPLLIAAGADGGGATATPHPRADRQREQLATDATAKSPATRAVRLAAPTCVSAAT